MGATEAERRRRERGAKGAERSGDWEGVWGSVVISPVGSGGGASAANAFLAHMRSTEHFW